MNTIKTYPECHAWQLDGTIRDAEQAMEAGQVLYFPQLAFILNDSETPVLTPDTVAKNRKNVSYDLNKDKLSGFNPNANLHTPLHSMMQRFATQSLVFMKALCPHYAAEFIVGRTSFRPVEIEGRQAPSIRKDDKRLHIDAFPTTPMHDKRIIRFFSNINPNGKPRLWRTGEHFNRVAERFAPHLKKPFPGIRKIMQWTGITRDYQSLYDHCMLAMHHAMKADTQYQNTVPQTHHALAAGSTWLTFTDQVSHAVDSGQYVLEQTFYLPQSAMVDPSTAPQAVMAKSIAFEENFT